jgi:hypothetical protein
MAFEPAPPSGLPCLERGNWAAAVVLVSAFAFVWCHLGTHLIYKTNEDRRRSDQQAAIDLAAQSRADFFPHRTNAVSNNLFAWTAARLVWNDDEQTFFIHGKWINLLLGGAALVIFAAILATFWGVLPAAALLGVSAFAAFLPRAVYFQPETFFYLLFTGACICGFALLRKNPLWLYGLFGAVCGLTWLAKPSNTPLLLVWLCAATLRWIVAILPSPWGRSVPSWKPAAHFGGLLLATLAGGLVVAPLGVWSAREYGAPFFNMTQYWMWQDDYGRESVPLLVQHGDARKIRSLPSELVPSAGNYFRTHSTREAFARLADGTWGKLSRFIFPEKKFSKRKEKTPHRHLLSYRGLYLLAFATAAGLFAIWAHAASRPLGSLPEPETGKALRWLWRPEASEMLFVFGTFAFYALAYGWYEPIGRGDRFMMTLYTPLLLWFTWVIVSAVRRTPGRAAHWLSVAFFAVLTAFVIKNVWRLLAWPEFKPDNPL